MESKKLLSIVVPTKNRYKYLKVLIKTILDFDFEDLELVVQDNTADNSEIIEFLGDNMPPIIRYFHESEPLSVKENSDLAVGHATGKYICFIGDDDGISKDIIKEMSPLIEREVDAILTKPVIYNWPDYLDNSIFKLSATLSYPYGPKTSRYVDVKKSLNKTIRKGYSSITSMPRVYQGIVKKSVLDELYMRCGTYFPGPSPDMASSIALSLLIKNLFYLDKPLIITGQCYSVGGGERVLGKLLPLSELSFLPKDIEKTWDDKIPKVWCSDTIWPASAGYAFKAMGHKSEQNYELLYARLILNHPGYEYLLDSFNYSKTKYYYYRMTLLFEKAIKFLFNRATFIFTHNIIGRDRVIRNVMNIKEAADYCNELR